MTDTITTETPVLGKVKSRHIGIARGAIYKFLKREGGEASVSLRRLALLVNKKLRNEGFQGFDLEDGKFAARKALAQMVERGKLEIIPTPANEHGMNLPPVYRLKGE